MGVIGQANFAHTIFTNFTACYLKLTHKNIPRNII